MHKKYKKYESMNDNELVLQIIKGDELAAIYLIIVICGSRLKFLATQKFKNLNLEFDEVVSELFLHLKQRDWKALRDFHGQNKSGRSCKISNYISLIASRLLWKKMEQAKKNIDWILSTYEVEVYLIPDESFERNQLVKCVIDAVMSLDNSGEREVLLLYKIQGRSVQEVAEILNISSGNVYTRCTRALKNLRFLLEQRDIYA